jgi:hypothetical protein
MEDVTVVFTNGNVVQFAAQKFKVSLRNTGSASSVQEFPYKDAEGNDSAIHLKPDDVSGLFVTPGGPRRSDDPAIGYTVAGQGG